MEELLLHRPKRTYTRNESANIYFGVLKDALDNFFGFDVLINDYNNRKLNLESFDESFKWIFSESKDYFSFNNIWEVLFPDWDIEKTKKMLLERFKQLYPGVKLRKIKVSKKLKQEDIKCQT